MRKPLCFTAIRERLEQTYKVAKYPTLEADDVMGILATKGVGDTIICSMDKDMMQIPGKLWDGKDLHVITETGGDYWHMYQTLVGDTTDGYKGCPGIGPAKAQKLLQEAIDSNAHLSGTVAHCCWPAVAEAFENAGLTETDALTQARLARILRASDWDFNKKEVKLWQPPTSSTPSEGAS
jgi:DNA polymerase-1